jgi:hypothetical protein
VRVAQHLQPWVLLGQQLDPGRPVRGVGGGQRTRGDQPGLRFGGEVALVAVAFSGAGLAGMARLRVDRGDDPVVGDPPGDPPRPGPLARFDVLAGDQRQQRDRLGLLGVQLQGADRLEHGQRVVDHPRHQRLGGLRVVPGAHWLARPVIVVGGQLDPARPWHQPPDRRIAATSWVTVSWVATASSKTVESSTRRHRPANTPVASTTSRTTSKIRRGRAEVRSRARQYTSTVGWNPSSSSRSPQATFQAMSRRSALMASRSLKPSSACSTSTVATTSAGTDGCPPPWRARSANSSAGNNSWRWSARKAYTDPWGPDDHTRSPRPTWHRMGGLKG